MNFTCARAPLSTAKGMLTNYAVNLDKKLVYRLIRLRSYPVHSRLVRTDASEHDFWCVRHVDTKNVDEFGNRLP